MVQEKAFVSTARILVCFPILGESSLATMISTYFSIFLEFLISSSFVFVSIIDKMEQLEPMVIDSVANETSGNFPFLGAPYATTEAEDTVCLFFPVPQRQLTDYNVCHKFETNSLLVYLLENPGQFRFPTLAIWQCGEC